MNSKVLALCRLDVNRVMNEARSFWDDAELKDSDPPRRVVVGCAECISSVGKEERGEFIHGPHELITTCPEKYARFKY